MRSTSLYARTPGRRGGLALSTAVPLSAGPALAAGPAISTVSAAAPAWGIGAVWRSLTEGVEWTLPFVAFLIYVATVVSNRFTVAQPAIVLASFGLLTQRAAMRVGRLGAGFALYVAWAVFCAALSPYREHLVEPATQMIKLVVIMIVGINAVRSRAQLRFVTAFILFWFAVYPARGATLNYVTGAFTVEGRAVWNGAYANPNDLAGITLLMLGLCASMAVEERAGLARWGARIGIPLMAMLIAITQSRGAIVATAVFGFAVFWTAGSAKLRLRAALAGLVALGAVLIFAPQKMWDRFHGITQLESENAEDRAGAESSARQRLEIWRVARTIAAEHPVTGVGIGAYPYAHAQTATRSQFSWIAGGERDTHSTYLNVLCEVGVPGFLMFFGLIAYVLVTAERARRRQRLVDPVGARATLMLELGLLAYLVAGIWGSYGKINMTYLMLLLVWARARAIDAELAGVPTGAPALQPSPARARLVGGVAPAGA